MGYTWVTIFSPGLRRSPEHGCQTCTSPAPHLHPAMQHEGEVQPCPDPFHDQVTAENTAEKIAKRHETMRRLAL